MNSTGVKVVGLALGAIAALELSVASASGATFKPVPDRFTVKGGRTTLESKSGERLVCSAAAGSGEITTSKAGTATFTFTGCESALLKCSTKGAKSGEVVFPLTLELVDISKSKKEVGFILKLTEQVTIECAGLTKLTFKVKGAALCPISPNKGAEMTVTCDASKGVQEPTSYEEGEISVSAPTIEIATGSTFEAAGLIGTFKLLFEQEYEIKP